MKKVKRFFMMAMAVLACTAPAIAQEEEKVETTVAADVVNQYIWRVWIWVMFPCSLLLVWLTRD
jgi:hypothetical protein